VEGIIVPWEEVAIKVFPGRQHHYAHVNLATMSH